MNDNYAPATVTPLSEVKTETGPPQQLQPPTIQALPRVNGFNTQINLIAPAMTSASSAATISVPHQGLPRSDSGSEIKPEPYWSNREQQCCLVDSGRRCTAVAGNASYSKRIQKTVAQRRLKLHMDNSARHIYICDHHKNVIQSVRAKRKRKDSEEDSGETDSEHPEVDLFQLQVNTLRRYKKHFKVPSRPGLNKAQLADNLMRHFKTIPVVEKEALTYFIYMIKTNTSKFDRERREED